MRTISVRAMCRLGQGNFCAFDWNSLPVGREFDSKFLKNVKSPPHALPPPPPRRLYIDRCIISIIKILKSCHLFVVTQHFLYLVPVVPEGAEVRMGGLSYP